MARLVSWQAKVMRLTLANGPASSGSGSNTMANGSEQSFAGWNFALAFEMSFPPSEYEQARKEYNWMLGLHNGANATRYEYIDGQQKTPSDVGEAAAAWDGASWSTGAAWGEGHGTVALSADVAKDATIVELANTKWGHALEAQEAISFGPSYYGAHFVTEVLAAGKYRVTPPIRAALTAGTHRANLEPRLALRFIPGSVNYGTFNPAHVSDRGARFVEVFNEYVSPYFGD